MDDKRLTKSYKSHNEPQRSHCLVMHDDAHLSYKRYKVRKLCFKGHPRYISTSIYKHTFLYFLDYYNQKKTTQTNKHIKKQ